MRRIAIAGASGYVGGRLLHRLEGEGFPIRCLARNPRFLRPRVAGATEVVEADVLDVASLTPALWGVHTAYYLVHSMGDAGSFERLDREGACNFREACREAGVSQIVYLGGLSRGGDLSPHLRSRKEVGDILRSGAVHAVEFRSSIILGSGSLSFELIRALVEKLPVMMAPRWVRTKTQPVSVEDVIDYLALAARLESPRTAVYEIGGPDVVSYEDLLKEYARQRGLRRWIVPVPVLTPSISSLWLGLITPVFARIGRKLVESLRNTTTVSDDSALVDFPVRPKTMREAIARALVNEDREYAETRWMDSQSSKGRLRRMDVTKLGPRIVARLSAHTRAKPEAAFDVIRRIGGDEGWYFANCLWRLRGFLDLLAGGVGLRRGRPHPVDLAEGDTLDFWRVETVDAPRLLRLRAEMKLPGRAWLQFEVKGEGEGAGILQTAVFDPLGLGGRLYWYALLPLHWIIFRGMLSAIAARAGRSEPTRIEGLQR